MQTDKYITVKEGQSLWDIALQEYGNIEAVFDLVKDNQGIISKIDDVPRAGTMLKIKPDNPLSDVATAQAIQSNGSLSGTIISDDDIPQGSYSNDYSNDYQI